MARLGVPESLAPEAAAVLATACAGLSAGDTIARAAELLRRPEYRRYSGAPVGEREQRGAEVHASARAAIEALRQHLLPSVDPEMIAADPDFRAAVGPLPHDRAIRKAAELLAGKFRHLVDPRMPVNPDRIALAIEKGAFRVAAPAAQSRDPQGRFAAPSLPPARSTTEQTRPTYGDALSPNVGQL